MITFVPMVVLVPASTVEKVDRIAEERWNMIPADARRDLENVMAQNGWTRWAMVAGAMVTQGVRE